MTRNRGHLLKLRHVNIAESANFSLWLRNLPAFNSTSWLSSITVSLSFSHKLDFVALRLFA
jgi:hypothetical protein